MNTTGGLVLTSCRKHFISSIICTNKAMHKDASGHRGRDMGAGLGLIAATVATLPRCVPVVYLVQQLCLACHLSCEDVLFTGEQPQPVCHLRTCLAGCGNQGHKPVALVANLEG